MTQALTGIQYALAAIILWVAFACRRPLAFPRWLADSEVFRARSGKGDLARAVGVFLLLMILDGIRDPEVIRVVTGQEPQGFLGPGLQYVVYLIGGYIAGRFGGRYGIAAVLTYLLFRVALPIVSIPVSLYFIESPSRGQIFIDRVVEEWIPLFLVTPQALVYTLAAAMWGAWQV